MKKLVSVFLDAFDGGAFGGNEHGVVRGGISTNHAAEREKAGRAAESSFGVTIHFHFETRRAGAFLAEDESPGSGRYFFLLLGLSIPKKLVKPLVGFFKNGCTPN